MYRTILDYMGCIPDFHQIGRRIYQSGSVLVPGSAVVVECSPYLGIARSPSFGLVPDTVVVADVEKEEGKIVHRNLVVDCNLTDRQYSVAASTRRLSNTLQFQSSAMVAPCIAAVGAGWLVFHMVTAGRRLDRRQARL